MIRVWTLGLLTVSTAVLLASPFTDMATDRVISGISAATFGTGAIVIRHPVGFRIILAVVAVLSALLAVGVVQG